VTESTRAIVIDALQAATGFLSDPVHGPAALAGKDVAFSALDIDSLSLFEAIMAIEDRMGLELDADEVAEQGGIDSLVAYLDRRKAAVA
jgi:acyl carrier protein